VQTAQCIDNVIECHRDTRRRSAYRRSRLDRTGVGGPGGEKRTIHVRSKIRIANDGHEMIEWRVWLHELVKLGWNFYRLRMVLVSARHDIHRVFLGERGL